MWLTHFLRFEFGNSRKRAFVSENLQILEFVKEKGEIYGLLAATLLLDIIRLPWRMDHDVNELLFLHHDEKLPWDMEL